jgi:dihydrofolate reductase
MRKIIVGAQVSMEGVMQAPGGPTEDPTKGFKFGGWSMPYFDQAFGEEIDHIFKNFDLLLGRKTYEIFAGSNDGFILHRSSLGLLPSKNLQRNNELNKQPEQQYRNVDPVWLLDST